MASMILKVGGMSCGGCVNSVTRVLSAVPGVSRVDVSLERGEARIEYDTAQAGIVQFKAAVEDAGYKVAG